jgi:hypothetical protein
MEAVANIFTNILSYVAPKPVRVIDEYDTVIAKNEAGEKVIIQIPKLWHYENLDKDDRYT